MQEIKLIDSPSQILSMRLNDRAVRFHFKFNTVSERWTFDLYIDNALVLAGRKVVVDTNLISPFATFNTLGILFATDPENQANVPNRTNLPAGLVRFFHTTVEEVQAALA